MSRRARGGAETPRGRCEMSTHRAAGTKGAERAREFWRGTLLAGAFIALPRWTSVPGLPAGAQPSPEMGAKVGVGEHEARIPAELVPELRRLTDELTVAVRSVLLTAHAKVLSALSGERDVSTGYVVMEGRSPLLCR